MLKRIRHVRGVEVNLGMNTRVVVDLLELPANYVRRYCGLKKEYLAGS